MPSLQELQKMGAKPIENPVSGVVNPVGSSLPQGTSLQDLKSQGATIIGSPIPITQSNPINPVDQHGALFPANPTDSPLIAGAKTAGNIIPSAINFAKNLVQGPVQGIIRDLPQIPGEASKLIQEQGLGKAVQNFLPSLADTTAKAVVPSGALDLLKGDISGAQKEVTNDPVGQILPFLMLGKSAATRAGYGAEFDNAISQVAKPITKPLELVGQGLGNIAAGAIGAGTGAGASSIKATTGGSEAFFNAMRGKTTPEETVQNMESAFNTLKQNRANDYTAKLQQISQDPNKNIDISPINQELVKQLSNFRVSFDKEGNLDFSRSPVRFDKVAQTDIKTIYDTMKDYGLQPGDRTPIGVDSLKRAFGDLYSPSSNVRAFIQSMKDSTRNVLNSEVPGYQDMTKGYEKASNLINDIKSATSLGKSNNYDAVFTKITSALKGDKDFRLQMLNELQNSSGQKLTDALAGHNLSKWIPTGLVGKGVDVAGAYGLLHQVFDPGMIAMAISTSPRIMGEFLGGLGVAKNHITPILQAINKVRLPSATGLLPQGTQSQQQSQSKQ